MHICHALTCGISLTAAALGSIAITAHAQAAREGARAFQYCAPCHSVEKGVNLTGPSLFGVWGRKAGTLPGFHRYSEALKQSGLSWDEKTLDAWIRDPAALVPGNDMRFPGLPDAAARKALIEYLHIASSEGSEASKSTPPDGSMAGGTMGA